MACDNIIDCLKVKGVDPNAYDNDIYSGYTFESAIIYNENYFFWTKKKISMVGS